MQIKSKLEPIKNETDKKMITYQYINWNQYHSHIDAQLRDY